MSTLSVVKTDVSKARKFLQSKLAAVLDKDIYEELEIVVSEIRTNKTPNYLNTAFSKAIRLFGKGELGYSVEERSTANKICNSWTPPKTIDKAVRILILLEIPARDENEYLKTIESLFESADLGEQVVIYSSLSLLAYPEKLVPRCMEGIRSNIGEVFEAVANENPFPAAYLSEDAFNQMTLKCLFVGKPLYKIENLHHRLNKNLARMAFDYAHERWAAGRELSPEIWQLVEAYLQPDDMKDIIRLSRSENELERKAAAICCSQCQITQAEEIYALSEYRMQVESGELNWFDIGYDIYKK
ncbi:MAG TPA: EboA domain-containing protein [Bacteroidia bacterium]|nr:EboA domain-containing protein [Bacteroidia bacterium]